MNDDAAADDTVLLTVRTAWFSHRKRTAILADGTELNLRGGPWPSRDWSLTDPSGHVALSIDVTSGAFSIRPDAYDVRMGDPRLTLAHVVGIVQLNRLLMEAARARARSSSS